jgi:hypothetical protein
MLWKTRLKSVFPRFTSKNGVFSALFEVCSLRSGNPLAIVQCGPSLSVEIEGEILATALDPIEAH